MTTNHRSHRNSNARAVSRSNPDHMEVDQALPNLKRSQPEVGLSAKSSQVDQATSLARSSFNTGQGKPTASNESQCTFITTHFCVPEKRTPKLWYGFATMEKMAIEAGIPECQNNKPIDDLVAQGFLKLEAIELSYAIQSFPRVPQTLYPLIRADGVPGQHFNLTQIPFKVETHSITGLALEYHVTIFFEQPSTNFSHNCILAKVQARLEKMEIPVGRHLANPITILCKNKSVGSTWAGIIKIHLDKLEEHAIVLLKGKRPVILELDGGISFVGKVTKGYDNIARNNLLSIKINSPELIDISAHDLFQEILVNSFNRGHEYEITSVQKNKSSDFTWIVAPSPNQAKKITTYHIPAHQELIKASLHQQVVKQSTDDRAKSNCLKLVIHHLHLLKTMAATTQAIKDLMGEKNVVQIYYLSQVGELHGRSANVECLNATVYTMFHNKSFPLFGKYIDFKPHPKSLKGNFCPPKAESERLGFNDINVALVNTIEALDNRPSQVRANITKDSIKALVEESIESGHKKLRTEMRKEIAGLKSEIIDEVGEMMGEMRAVQDSMALALTGLQNWTKKFLPAPQDK